ncbi:MULTISPECIES: hypothetical protein [unclassified Pseudomonas]|uniref:hypothetical protein n=1 Tax=unclassified Pseudomonas TaxID=196821 RepID=UPI0011C34C38|nr:MULTISPECIES: hypothetical protein [unclassified Pseudomonas]
MEELKNIHKAFINHLGKENAKGLCHVISVCTMRWMNEISYLDQSWRLCLGKFSSNSISEEHYWLEGSSPSNGVENFLDMTADQFGSKAPLLSIGRPPEYILETNKETELTAILEAAAVDTWMPLVKEAVSRVDA